MRITLFYKLLGVFILLSFLVGTPLADEIVALDTRPSVQQLFLLLEPKGKPRGIVIIFPDRTGVVRFRKKGKRIAVKHEGGGFTVRKETRETYQKNGFVVALLARPSDRPSGMDKEFRSSEEHLKDLRVIERGALPALACHNSPTSLLVATLASMCAKVSGFQATTPAS